jgi:N-acetyl-anhydromuramyl-L-alanine amidase AmpD
VNKASPSKSSSSKSSRKPAAGPQRRVVVFSGLVLALTLTSALLLALAPAPLTPDASASLFAVDAPDAMDVIFQTRAACAAGRWKYVYIHHSRTATGNAMSVSQSSPGHELGDHFVIGNGDGAADGEIQVGQRWDTQSSAFPPAGAARIDPNCISICLIGDFDKTKPTPAQIRRLGQLVNALQARFHIAAADVSMITTTTPAPKKGEAAGSVATIGKHFPATAFREQLLP